MNSLTNCDIKRFFIRISCILGSFILLSQILNLIVYGAWNLMLLLLSAAASAGIFGSAFLYFKKENRLLEGAADQINSFLSGDVDSQIECDQEGSIYKLFHAVNTLAAVLNAQAVKEQNVKEFLKSTISDISHQLKTPIAALNIYNGILQDEFDDASVMREFAKKSEQELERMEMLVQSLLKITKLDAGSMVIEKSPELVADMMNDVWKYFNFRADQEKKTITLSGPEDVILVCDRNWMTEAVGNLVKNALDHTGEGGCIEIEWKKLPAITQITIRDNGVGIHPEDIHHIFKRFYRSRFSKDIQGIGLGLPLAKAIVEEHNGNITVDSMLGGGSTFTLSFLNLTKM